MEDLTDSCPKICVDEFCQIKIKAKFNKTLMTKHFQLLIGLNLALYLTPLSFAQCKPISGNHLFCLTEFSPQIWNASTHSFLVMLLPMLFLLNLYNWTVFFQFAYSKPLKGLEKQSIYSHILKMKLFILFQQL